MSSSAFLNNLKQLFVEYDSDKNGSLGRREFYDLCAKIGLSQEAATETFDRLDVDRDDKITFDEFAAGFNQYSGRASPSGSVSPSRRPQSSSAIEPPAQPIRSASTSKISSLARQKKAKQVGIMSLSSTGSNSSGSSTGGGSSSVGRLEVSDIATSSHVNSLNNDLMVDGLTTSGQSTGSMAPRSIVYDSEQSGFGSLMSDSSLNQVKTFQDLVDCIQKLQNENQILSQTFFKDKREREEYISQLGEEFDQQVREVEERASRRARQELEAEKKRLRDMMQAERETLQHHYQTIEKMSKLIKSNISSNDSTGTGEGTSGEENPNLLKVKSKLEDTYLENRKLKKSLLDTKSDVAMIRREMEKLKRQYELKLSSAYEKNDETRSECDHIKQQLDLMKDSNRKLQDASDVITNYITDKIDPVIKGAQQIDDDLSANHFLSPDQSCIRKGSILSEYLNNQIDDGEHSQPYSIDGTMITIVPSEDLPKLPRAALSNELIERVESQSDQMSSPISLNSSTDQLAPESEPKKSISESSSPDLTSDKKESSGLRQLFRKTNRSSLEKLLNSKGKAKVEPPVPIETVEENTTIEPADGPSKATFNIILVGDSFVGKSSFAARFMEGTFVQGLVSNCSIDFKTKAYKIDGTNYTVNLWDTVGQERFRSITASYFRKADGVVLMYDVTDKRSYLNVRNWMSTIADTASDKVSVLLVGNKIDLRTASNEHDCVPSGEGQRMAREYGIVFLETSVKTGTNLVPTIGKLIRLIIKNTGTVEEDKDRIRLNDKSKVFNCMPKNC